MTENRSIAWLSPPGDTIADLLEERGWSKAELAQRLGCTPKHVSQLLSGAAPIHAEMAAALARVLGSTAERGTCGGGTEGDGAVGPTARAPPVGRPTDRDRPKDRHRHLAVGLCAMAELPATSSGGRGSARTAPLGPVAAAENSPRPEEAVVGSATAVSARRKT